MEEKETKKYELTFWLKDEDASPVKKVLEKHGAAVSAERPFAKFRLSYPIKREANAFMNSVAFTADPLAMPALTADLNATVEVLRFLLSVAPETPRNAAAAPGREATETGVARGRAGIFHRGRVETVAGSDILTNEALEKKIEEISK